ncbi:hypothetical protein PtA15_9A188 [Puccinia triticina]|uniref:Uncharacterized protein n=1 Tax=Puccinia triticina TaxID=208348 RepID=A0ABY7CUQ2_9BASI|nr:uncharacterized protein PtA15_9A188 [Puccinia triticina]WAQ88063.1 hypothetical protein PtA15_9A188 [Puccinia triticina]WAR60251.1 hypothetical protein PtB15_9B188 [Puccinia triticina]
MNPNDPDDQTQNSSESEPETQDEISSNDSDDDERSASDSKEILTSNYSETSGSNDPSYSTASNTDSELSKIDSSFAHEKYQRNLVKNLLLAGHRGPQILKILKEEHGIKISPCNLSQKQKQWGLRVCDLQQRQPPALLTPKVQAIISSHSKGMNLEEIRARLANETGVDVVLCTIKRYLSQLNLKILRNDVADGTVAMEQVFAAVHDA